MAVYGSEVAVKRWASLVRFREQHIASATEATANAYITKRSFETVNKVYLNGTAITTHTATRPKTIAFGSLTVADVIEIEADVALTLNTVSDYLEDASSWIEGELTAAGFDITTLTDDSLDMVTSMWAAFLLRMAEYNGNRQEIDAYTLKLERLVNDLMMKIKNGDFSIVDAAGDVTAAVPTASYTNLSASDTWRDPDTGDWKPDGSADKW